MAKTKKIKVPAVIYDMPDSEYHALERLSCSGIKKLLVSSQDFWKSSWMNTNKHEGGTKSMNLGTAYHKRILEGKAAFEKAYAVKPECDRRTKEGKQIYADFVAFHPDAEIIEQRVKDEIEEAAERIEKTPELANYFAGGKSEVTLLWDDPETGVPMKSRLDYLAGNGIVDLKTFSNSFGVSLDHVISNHIVRYKYYLQAEVYREAVRQAVKKDDMLMIFVFQQTGGINNTVPVGFGADLLLADKGRMEMRRGIEKFAEMFRKYGTAEWFDEPEFVGLIDEAFPLYVLED